MKAPGTIFIVSAPSGAGKTSLVKALVQKLNHAVPSISHTTRPKRPNEVDGENYHFISYDDFVNMIDNDEFLEYARVFENFYGTSIQAVIEQIEAGLDVILEIDWQGAQIIREKFHPNTVSVFIVPPSRQALHKRLLERDQDDAKTIEHRMSKATAEISHYQEFEYLVVNDDFTIALDELCAIFTTHRLHRLKQEKRHQKLLADLMTESE